MQTIRTKIPLKKLIQEQFTKQTGKIFYSFEVTPKENYVLDATKLITRPLFIDITWIGDNNLKYPSICSSPALKLKKDIEGNFNVVNTLSCYRLEESHVDELLSEENDVKNFVILRGDSIEENQKYKYANDLIKDIRRKTEKHKDDITIFGACFPETRDIARDMKVLREKIDSGVDVLLTQLIFGSEKFCEFVKTCRNEGITIPIIPGLYIPYNFNELQSVSKITRAEMPPEYYEKFEKYRDDPENFQSLGLSFTSKIIREIQENSSEHIPGYHFFSMNNMTMINKMIEIIKFSGI